MRRHRKMLLIFFAITLAITPGAFAGEQNHHQQSATDQGVQLSPNLKKLLNQEMTAIQQGMIDLIPALAAGDWQTAATIGKNIKASFIMKQRLTQAQKKELHRVLPADFIAMDQAFHKTAGMLAHAAEMKNAEVLNFYFFKLNEACVSCHSKYATERFPGFASSDEASHQH